MFYVKEYEVLSCFPSATHAIEQRRGHFSITDTSKTTSYLSTFYVIGLSMPGVKSQRGHTQQATAASHRIREGNTAPGDVDVKWSTSVLPCCVHLSRISVRMTQNKLLTLASSRQSFGLFAEPETKYTRSSKFGDPLQSTVEVSHTKEQPC